MTAIAYAVLEQAIIACNGPDSLLARAVGKDTKAKLSMLVYLAAIPLAFVRPAIAIALYVVVAGVWLVPDRRIESLEDSRAGG